MNVPIALFNTEYALRLPLAPPTAISVKDVTAVLGVAIVVMPDKPTVVVGGG